MRSILDTKLTNSISPLHYSYLVGCSQKYCCSFSHTIVEWTLTVGNGDMVRAGAWLLSVWLRHWLESQWTPPPPLPLYGKSPNFHRGKIIFFKTVVRLLGQLAFQLKSFSRTTFPEQFLIYWPVVLTAEQIWWQCFTPVLVIYVLQFLRTIIEKVLVVLGFPGSSDSKKSACSAGDLGSIPGLGRCPGEENGNPLQYSCLENPKDRGARWATVHGVAKIERLTLFFPFVPLSLFPFVTLAVCQFYQSCQRINCLFHWFSLFLFCNFIDSVFHYFLPCASFGFILLFILLFFALILLFILLFLVSWGSNWVIWDTSFLCVHLLL